MAIGLVFLATSQCQFCDREGICCSSSALETSRWAKPSLDVRRALDCSSISFRCRSTFFGGMQSCGLPTAQDLSLSKVRVAADYSDSVPDSPNYMGVHGYHPLEELRDHGKKKDVLLTDAEIARTTAEANTKALLVFPGGVHCEPHGHVSWSEFQYVIDDYGDIFFEFYDDESILEDPRAINPVTVLIGMDNSIPGEARRITGNYNEIMDRSIDDDDDDDYDEIDYTEVTDTLIKWGMPETLRQIHPLYFAKRLTKSVHAKYGRKMDLPSNGLSMLGFLRPAFLDEESYLRSLFDREDGDGYSSEWKDEAEEEKVDGNFDLIGDSVLQLSSTSLLLDICFLSALK